MPNDLLHGKSLTTDCDSKIFQNLFSEIDGSVTIGVSVNFNVDKTNDSIADIRGFEPLQSHSF